MLQKRQEELNISMVGLENLMYRGRYQTDTSVRINSNVHFCKEKESESNAQELVFSVWFQTDICLTNEYLFETNIPNNTLYMSLFNNHLVLNA